MRIAVIRWRITVKSLELEHGRPLGGRHLCMSRIGENLVSQRKYEKSIFHVDLGLLFNVKPVPVSIVSVRQILLFDASCIGIIKQKGHNTPINGH